MPPPQPTNKIASPFLRLPPELRHQIYSYLLPLETTPHPLPGTAISSTTHRLPNLPLLTITPQLTDEILTYFYTLATFKLIFSHAFNFFRADPHLQTLEQSPALHSIRKIEIVFFCDILLLKNYPSFGLTNFCAEIRRRAERACEVLAQARSLRCVTVSWIDTTLTGGWEEKAAVLEPLRALVRHPFGSVVFRVGQISSAEDLGRDVFRAALARVLGPEAELEDGSEDVNDGPSRLRMLAFDVRQEKMRRFQAGPVNFEPELWAPVDDAA